MLLAGLSTHWYSDFNGVAALVVCSVDSGVHFEATVATHTDRPYQSGHLAYRDVPAYLELLARVPAGLKVDVVMVDGAGMAHPRRAGTAVELAALTGLPTVGVTRSPIIHPDCEVATPVACQPHVNPVFVSVGGNITHERAVEVVRECFGSFRRPRPIRLAHILAKATAHGHSS